jgi:hypothetical protein
MYNANFCFYSLAAIEVLYCTGAWMSVSCECFVLPLRGLCNGPIARPEMSYRLWCVIVCDLDTSRKRRACSRLRSCAVEENKICKFCHITHNVPVINYTLH